MNKISNAKNKRKCFRRSKKKLWKLLHEWKCNLLCAGGKEILIKVVAYAIFTHIMSCFMWLILLRSKHRHPKNRSERTDTRRSVFMKSDPQSV